MTKAKKTSWEEEKLGHLEKMLTNLSHLTGQHYKDEFWVNIVKAGVLDLWLWFADIMEKREIQVRQEAVRETIEEIRQWHQDMGYDDGSWIECEKWLASLKKEGLA